MSQDPLYLDYNASTPPALEVVEAMLPWLGFAHANPHAEHLAGRRCAAAIDRALEQIGSLIGADPQDIVLTSGATESNNLAIQGVLLAANSPFDFWHSTIEHKAVLEVARFIAKQGGKVHELPVNALGRCEIEFLRGAGDGGRRPFVSVMHANNEIGTIQPIEALSAAVAQLDGLLHVDAAQSCGRIPIQVVDQGIDLLSLSAHKLYGPSGIGALYISRRARAHLRPLMYGGGQQDGLRPGTVPDFLAVGFGAACEIAQHRITDDAEHVELLARCFIERLQSLKVVFRRLGDPAHRLPGLLSILLEGQDGDHVVAKVSPKLSISTGSACTSGELLPSHVLRAIGLSDSAARSVVRLGFGRNSTIEESVRAAELLAAAVL